jgi:hypothetical protein
MAGFCSRASPSWRPSPSRSNVLLRDKYVTYVLSFAAVGGLFYLYTQGYNQWLYNPVLYGLWNYADLAGTSGSHPPILTHRVYCLAITFMSLGLAHLSRAGWRRDLRAKGRSAATAGRFS